MFNHRLKLFQAIVLPLILQIFFASVSHATQDSGIALPRYSTIDRNGVNLTTGQVTSTLATVSIGGEMGLSHSIAGRTNQFSYKGLHGYDDKFDGRAQWTLLGSDIRVETQNQVANAWVMRASAMGDSQDFKVMRNGVYQATGTNLTSNYYYEALGDKRHTLERNDSGLVWIKPDGTEVYFYSGGHSSATGKFRKIVYPNGFTVNVHFDYSVTTNTGYQLKYEYTHEDSGLAFTKRSQSNTIASRSGNNLPPQSTSSSWYIKNPRHVIGINNAVEYCNPGTRTPCNLDRDWPKATFNWPGGMPRAFYIGKSIFSVEDSTGGLTEYHFEAQDLALNDGSAVNLSFLPGTRFSPRLVAIKPAWATEPTLKYSYKNQYDFNTIFLATYPQLSTDVGRLDKVESMYGSGSLSERPIEQGRAPIAIIGSRMEVISHQLKPTTLYEVRLFNDRTIRFEDDYRNFVWSVSDPDGISKNYYYDDRNNMNRATYGATNTVLYRAQYPSTCENRKTCNQPTWTEDANGNRTHYTYHASSGMIASMTDPANDQGLVAQTRYEYTQKKAKVRNASNQLVPVSEAIWLKTAEKHCANSNFSGSCQGNDEVVTRYEYNHDNLLLTGMTVTADGQTLRTCYAYDIYGHKVGETEPNANLSSCN